MWWPSLALGRQVDKCSPRTNVPPDNCSPGQNCPDMCQPGHFVPGQVGLHRTFSCSKVYTVIGSAGYYLPRVRDMCSGFWWIFPRQVLDNPATRSPCLGNVVCLNNCIFSDDKMRPEIKLPAPGSSLFCRCLNNFHPTPLLNYKIMQFLQKQNSSSFTIL